MALGKTLRQFCQENGLIEGYISPLERGLLPAPQSRDILVSDAAHLRLKKGSDALVRVF